MRRLIIPLLFFAGGCVSLDDVVGGIANTPEWFQERRVEFRGDGFPDFSDVPNAGDIKAEKSSLEAKEYNTRVLRALFLSDERSQVSDTGVAEIDAKAERMSELLVLPDGAFEDMMTSAEIAALRKKLRPPPIAK